MDRQEVSRPQALGGSLRKCAEIPCRPLGIGSRFGSTWSEAERDAAVAAPAADDVDAAKVAQPAKLGGIELATVLVREALHRPFANRRASRARRDGRLRRAHTQSLRQRRQAPRPGHLQGG